MSDYADLLLFLVLIVDLYVIAIHRLSGFVRMALAQGVFLALLPLALWSGDASVPWPHLLIMSLGTLLIKAGLIPMLLRRAIRLVHDGHETEPFVSLHLPILLALLLVGISFGLASVLRLPIATGTQLLVPTAFATVLLGFQLLITRRLAITQVVGYLFIENGIFIFGLILAHQMPLLVELSILLDLLVGIFVMGIAIRHISREFEHIDTERLAQLKD